MSDSHTTPGLIRVSGVFSEGWFRRCLPPEHTIIATRRVDDSHTDYVIRGKLTRGYDYFKPIFTMHRLEQGIRLTGDIDGSSWVIGEWPSFEAFNAERASYDAR